MSKKLSFEEFVERSNKTHENNDLIYDESSFNGSHQKVRIICPKHGEFWQIAKDHMNGQGCPICGREKVVLKDAQILKNSFLRLKSYMVIN